MNSKLTTLHLDNIFTLGEINQTFMMFSPSSQRPVDFWVGLGFWVPAARGLMRLINRWGLLLPLHRD